METFPRSQVNYPLKSQWHGALMFSSICARANDWVNIRDAGDLRRHRSQYDVTVMTQVLNRLLMINSLWPCNAICVNEHCDCYLKLLFVACLVPSPLLNQHWLLLNARLDINFIYILIHTNILFLKLYLDIYIFVHFVQGAVSIRKTVLPGMAIPMLKIRRPNGRLIFNMEIAIRR